MNDLADAFAKLPIWTVKHRLDLTALDPERGRVVGKAMLAFGDILNECVCQPLAFSEISQTVQLLALTTGG